MRAAIGLLLLQIGLQIVDRGRGLIDGVGILFDQVLHHAHALFKRLLHVGHLVLQCLYLGLQLDEVAVHAPARAARQDIPANKPRITEAPLILIVGSLTPH